MHALMCEGKTILAIVVPASTRKPHFSRFIAADLPITVSLFVRTYEKSPGKMRTNTGTLPESTWLSD
jgi:hypothetical protein